jgi:hypothetical protein
VYLKQDFPEVIYSRILPRGVCYSVVGRYMKSRLIVDDVGNEVWVSGKLFKKFFKEAVR